MINNKEILNKVDHTLLKQSSTWNEIKTICDDAIKCNTASVCIPPCFVKQAKEYVGDKMKEKRMNCFRALKLANILFYTGFVLMAVSLLLIWKRAQEEAENN